MASKKHISLDQRQAIKVCQREGMESLVTAEKLGIDHRTVKLWYGRDDIVPQEREFSAFRKVVLEAVRVLAWPTPRAIGAMNRYKSVIEPPIIDAIRRKPLLARTGETQEQAEQREKSRQTEQRRSNATFNKDYQRFLNSFHATENVKKRWEWGTWAVHAVKIRWYQHEESDKWVKQSIPKEGAKLVVGWLLILANRSSVTATGRQQWKVKLHFSVLSGEILDKKESSKIVADFVNNDESKVSILCLVTADDGTPTATLDQNAMMKQVNAAVQVVTDKPTSGVDAITVDHSFPSHQALENFLAAIIAYPNSLPASGADWWRDLRLRVADDGFVEEQFGIKRLFLSR